MLSLGVSVDELDKLWLGVPVPDCDPVNDIVADAESDGVSDSLPVPDADGVSLPDCVVDCDAVPDDDPDWLGVGEQPSLVTCLESEHGAAGVVRARAPAPKGTKGPPASQHNPAPA